MRNTEGRHFLLGERMRERRIGRRRPTEEGERESSEEGIGPRWR